MREQQGILENSRVYERTAEYIRERDIAMYMTLIFIGVILVAVVFLLAL